MSNAPHRANQITLDTLRALPIGAILRNHHAHSPYPSVANLIIWLGFCDCKCDLDDYYWFMGNTVLRQLKGLPPQRYSLADAGVVPYRPGVCRTCPGDQVTRVTCAFKRADRILWNHDNWLEVEDPRSIFE